MGCVLFLGFPSETLGQTSNGKIWAWGHNGFGQSDVPSPNTGFIAIAAGFYHSLALENLDSAPPGTSATISPSPNLAGWNNLDAVVTLSAEDNEGGTGVKEIRYSLTGATSVPVTSVPGNSAQINISAEGTTNLNYWAVDNAGNEEATKTQQIYIDKTPPLISGSINPAPNAAGWNNADVTVSFSASDGLSGIASITPPQTISSEGAGQTISGEAVDKAGNAATTHVVVNIDKSAPVITITATPNILWPPNNKMVNVKIGGSAVDGISGISSITFKVKDEYGKVEPAITGFGSSIQLEASRDGNDMDGRVYTITVVVRDKAGNERTASTTVLVPHDQR